MTALRAIAGAVFGFAVSILLVYLQRFADAATMGVTLDAWSAVVGVGDRYAPVIVLLVVLGLVLGVALIAQKLKNALGRWFWVGVATGIALAIAAGWFAAGQTPADPAIDNALSVTTLVVEASSSVAVFVVMGFALVLAWLMPWGEARARGRETMADTQPASRI